MAYALDFARRNRAKVVVLHVLDQPSGPLPAEPGQETLQGDHTASEASGRRILQEVAETAAQIGVAVETHLTVGDPSDEIVRLGQKLPADLIVMGANGMGGQARNVGASTTRGSVVTKVVRRARRPVLITELTEHDA
jgi:nucleotide-binding universal stress UspA family protein